MSSAYGRVLPLDQSSFETMQILTSSQMWNRYHDHYRDRLSVPWYGGISVSSHGPADSARRADSERR